MSYNYGFWLKGVFSEGDFYMSYVLILSNNNKKPLKGNEPLFFS